MTGMNYRHNVMEVNSIDTFLNIKGGCNNHTRDVYFVRGIGEPPNIEELIADTDKKMGIEMSHNRLKYHRVNSLPQLRDIADSDYYSAAYDKWTEGAIGSLHNINFGKDLKIAVSDALSMILDKYKEIKKSATPSMIRNFATKVLYWLDQTVAETLSDWSEKACIKIIADNVVKEQEYLFYLFLTFIGCDVFLIENRADINAQDELLKYSHKLVLGEFGTSFMKPYVRYVPEKKVKIPVRNEKFSADIRVQSAARKQNTVREEKSFEELAQLASSVVLIAVHDADRNIIGTGSGIMIGRNGFILTNNHVAAGGRFYSVRIEDEEEVYVTDEVIKYNSTTDLAVIRIKRQLNPIPIYGGEKKLVRGQKVVAIGSPLGLFNSVSDGIISGFRRINDVDMIQFTAPISNGSSGGAVLNVYGEVIGISTAGFDDGQNINLAIGYENIRMFTSGFTN